MMMRTLIVASVLAMGWSVAVVNMNRVDEAKHAKALLRAEFDRQIVIKTYAVERVKE